MSERAGFWPDLLLAAALAAAPAMAALLGAPGPGHVTLNLGPGDAPYIDGFFAEYEIFDRTGTHWSKRDAAIELPLHLEGGPASLSYRLGRPLEDPGEAAVSWSGLQVDRFSLTRAAETRTATLPTLPQVPMRVGFHVEATDTRPHGVRLDWVRFDLGPGARVALRGPARWRAALLAVLIFALLRGARWNRTAAALLTVPCALAAAVGLRADPWLTHRLLTGIPEWLGVLGFTGVCVGRVLEARGLVEGRCLRLVVALGSAAFLVRSLALNHPDFYYPDLRSHVRLAQQVRETGLEFFRSPSEQLLRHGVWSREVAGRRYSFPYTPAFHAEFALTSLRYDDLATAVKACAAAWSVVPIVALVILARNLGASAIGAALLIFVPVYGHHLSVAYLAAVFGHAYDMSFLAWLASRLERIRAPAVWLGASVSVAACELAYVGATMVVPTFVVVLALVDFVLERNRRRAIAILGFGLAGSALAFVVYYRDFLGLVLHVLRLEAAGLPVVAAGDALPAGILETALNSLRRFFPVPWSLLGAGGLVLLLRRGPGRALLTAWAAAYGALLVGRAKLPLFFQHPHEALFVAPLVCLGAGEAVAPLLAARGWRRILGVVLLAWLVVLGLAQQWSAFTLQLANAQ